MGVSDEKAKEGVDISFEEFAEINEQRSLIYGFLSRLYSKEIDVDLLSELRQKSFPVSTGNTGMDEGYRLLAGYVGRQRDLTVLELAQDYFRTFIGQGVDAYSAAYPFESVYTSKKRLLMQEARDQVIAEYRSSCLDKDESWVDCEDHIALELEFVGVLASRTAEALRSEDRELVEGLLLKQQQFLAEHLAAWTPMMTKDMRKFAKTDFYQGLAAITDGFLKEDLAFLKGSCVEGDLVDETPQGDDVL